jgi:putative membrane protein
MSKVAWVVVVVLVVILVVAVAIPLILLPMSGHMYSYGYGGMMGPWMMGGFGPLGTVISILFVVLLVAGGVWLFQSAGRGTAAAPPPVAETPLDILKRRYASGEITKKQFEEVKKDLGL